VAPLHEPNSYPDPGHRRSRRDCIFVPVCWGTSQALPDSTPFSVPIRELEFAGRNQMIQELLDCLHHEEVDRQTALFARDTQAFVEFLREANRCGHTGFTGCRCAWHKSHCSSYVDQISSSSRALSHCSRALWYRSKTLREGSTLPPYPGSSVEPDQVNQNGPRKMRGPDREPPTRGPDDRSYRLRRIAGQRTDGAESAAPGSNLEKARDRPWPQSPFGSAPM